MSHYIKAIFKKLRQLIASQVTSVDVNLNHTFFTSFLFYSTFISITRYIGSHLWENTLRKGIAFLAELSVQRLQTGRVYYLFHVLT